MYFTLSRPPKQLVLNKSITDIASMLGLYPGPVVFPPHQPLLSPLTIISISIEQEEPDQFLKQVCSFGDTRLFLATVHTEQNIFLRGFFPYNNAEPRLSIVAMFM